MILIEIAFLLLGIVCYIPLGWVIYTVIKEARIKNAKG